MLFDRSFISTVCCSMFLCAQRRQKIQLNMYTFALVFAKNGRLIIPFKAQFDLLKTRF